MTTVDPDRIQQYETIMKAAEAIGAHVEPTCSGELVIYTGIALDAKDNPVDWCEECESGADVPDDGCEWCGREARQQGSNDGQSETSLADGPSTLPDPTIGAD